MNYINIKDTDADITFPFLADIPELDLCDLAKESRIRDYQKGSSIFLEGDPAENFYVILSGWVKLFRNTPEGEEVVVGLLSCDDMFGESALFAGKTYQFNAQSTLGTKVAEIPGGILRKKAQETPEILYKIIQTLSGYIHRLQLDNEHLIFMMTPQRIGCLLLQLAADAKKGSGANSYTGCAVQLPYDKALAASSLGMKPETFSRAMTHLKDAGVEIKGKNVSIANIDSLVDYCCKNCSSDPKECLLPKLGKATNEE